MSGPGAAPVPVARLIWRQMLSEIRIRRRIPAFSAVNLALPVVFYAFFGLPVAQRVFPDGRSNGAHVLASIGAYAVGSVKVYSFNRIQDAMVDLAAGRITAVMKVYPVAAWLARQTADLAIVAEVPDDPQPLGIGFARTNPGLLRVVNRALADMKQDGTYARLAQKWGVP